MGDRGKRAPLMLLGVAALLAGLYGGLRRVGWDMPELRSTLLMAHGPLMVCGFLGTVICLERAVALGRGWGILAPMLAAAGGVMAITGLGTPAAWLALAASVLLLAMFVDFVRKQPAVAMVVMAVASGLWLVGNALWIAGYPLNEVMYWWMGFIVLTIFGERYAFSRMMAPSKTSKWLFGLSNAFVLAGLLVVVVLSARFGAAMVGAGLLAASVWIAFFDISRKTARQTGLPRYVAVSVQLGGAWMIVGGALLVIYRDIPAGPVYDAIVHSVFVGFAFSMIFGHAPLIFPSVLKIPLQYRPYFYLPLVMLHASVLFHILSDLYGLSEGRKWGALLNAAAILLFFAANIASAIGAKRKIKAGTSGAVATVIVVLTLLATAPAGAQEDALARSRDMYQEAIAAYNEKDYGTYLRVMRDIDALRPNHPRVVYMLAGAWALGGNGDEAVAALERLAAMGLIADPSEDADFASIRDSAGFAAVLERFDANARPLGNSVTAVTVPGQKDFIPEGVAYDALTGNFYVGSVYKRAIVEVRPEEARSFGAWERGDGLWSVFALRVDPVRRVLWVCSSAIKQTKWVREDEIGYAGVFKYDLTSRLVVKRFILSNSRGKHLFGDMALSRSGDVYVSDGAEGTIYRVGGVTGVFDRWFESDRFASPQGLAFSDDERYLFVADYSYGIFRIGMKDRSMLLLPAPDDLAIMGIDGLAFYDGDLVVIQNGVRPHRVLRLTLGERMDRITGWETLEANHPDFDEPTLGVVVPGPRRQSAVFYYVANSHWGAFDREGKLRKDADLTPPVILELDLD